jgi:hypothetical protein
MTEWTDVRIREFSVWGAGKKQWEKVSEKPNSDPEGSSGSGIPSTLTSFVIDAGVDEQNHWN